MTPAPAERRRSLGARVQGLEAARKVVMASRDLRASEREEALICLAQTIELLHRIGPYAAEIGALLAQEGVPA